MSENAALEATKNIDIAGALWTAMQPALPYLAGFFLFAIFIGFLQRPKQTKAQKQHAYNERRSWDDLKLIRSMAPLENPGRVFGYPACGVDARVISSAVPLDVSFQPAPPRGPGQFSTSPLAS